MVFKSKVKKGRQIAFLIILLVAFILGGGLFLLSTNFQIKAVNIKTNNISCTDENKIRSSLNLPTNIFLLNENDLEKNLKNLYFCIGEVSLIKKYPSQIEIFVFGRAPSVFLVEILEVGSEESSISGEASRSGFIADRAGVIFSKSESNFGLPVILIEDQLKLGEEIEQNAVEICLKVIEELQKVESNIDKFLIKPQKLVTSLGKPRIIVSLQKDIKVQLTALQLILQKAKIDNKELESVDLRFENPVIKYASK